ncbi:hypothetical protein ACK3TF_005764 [Chlorella vulgaris]
MALRALQATTGRFCSQAVSPLQARAAAQRRSTSASIPTAYAHSQPATVGSSLDFVTRPSQAHTIAAPHRSPPPPTPEPLLAYELVQGALVRYSSGAPSHKVPTAVLVHGILGKRQNMLSFARRLVEGFPNWQVVVVDLRCHGESASHQPPRSQPNTVESAASDVVRLLSALKLFPEMLIGHSFGGKVVLEMTKAWSAAARRVPRPVQVWVLDALPGEVRSGDMGGADRPADLISMLLAMPPVIPSRHWLISQLEAANFSSAVARWAATNLAPLASGAPGLTWAFDLQGIRQMFRSYESTDLWPLLAAPSVGVKYSFVKAERSTFRWGGGDEARIRALGHAVHELPASGHWVHTDNPDGLFDILAPSFGGEVDLHLQRSPGSTPRPSMAAMGVANNIAPSPSALASDRQLQGLMM